MPNLDIFGEAEGSARGRWPFRKAELGRIKQQTTLAPTHNTTQYRENLFVTSGSGSNKFGASGTISEVIIGGGSTDCGLWPSFSRFLAN